VQRNALSNCTLRRRQQHSWGLNIEKMVNSVGLNMTKRYHTALFLPYESSVWYYLDSTGGSHARIG
jgi:hypothetical protein